MPRDEFPPGLDHGDFVPLIRRRTVKFVDAPLCEMALPFQDPAKSVPGEAPERR